MRIKSDGIIIAILIGIVLGFLGVRYLNEQGYTDIGLWNMFTTKNDFTTYQLGTASRVGSVGVELHYDVEPVTIYLIGPDGTEYSERNHSATLIHDSENKIITFLVSTNQTGDWFVKFNNGRNQHIQYKFLNKASSNLYLQDPELIEQSGNTYISFTPVMGEPTDTRPIINTTIMLNNMSKSYVLFSDTINVNTEQTILIDIPESAYEYEEYTLLLSVSYTNDDGEMQSDKYTRRVRLQK